MCVGEGHFHLPFLDIIAVVTLFILIDQDVFSFWPDHDDVALVILINRDSILQYLQQLGGVSLISILQDRKIVLIVRIGDSLIFQVVGGWKAWIKQN